MFAQHISQQVITNTPEKVLTVSDCCHLSIVELLKKFGLLLSINADRYSNIPGSYWGDSEAGLISNTLYVRDDTPTHSLLHEACHYICMDNTRRQVIDTNAEGDYDEENGVCFLQILLADELPEMGQNRMMQDMDSWGYTFRLGSAKAWFNNDAEDALIWLKKYNILDQKGNVNYCLRT